MAGKLDKAREAVVQFLAMANPNDEFFLVGFGDTASLSVPFTQNPGDIQSRLMFTGSAGKTALLDGIQLALDYMGKARNQRKALLVISDGGDNESRYSRSEVRRRVEETDVWIYALGIYARGAPTLPEEERGGPELLTDLAERTGGRQFAVYSATELPDAAARIALELRNQYVLAYRPSDTYSDGKYHRVQVKLVDRADLHLFWRPGYYAPIH